MFLFHLALQHRSATISVNSRRNSSVQSFAFKYFGSKLEKKTISTYWINILLTFMEFLFSCMKSIVDKLVAPLWNFDNLFMCSKFYIFWPNFHRALENLIQNLLCQTGYLYNLYLKCIWIQLSQHGWSCWNCERPTNCNSTQTTYRSSL